MRCRCWAVALRVSGWSRPWWAVVSQLGALGCRPGPRSIRSVWLLRSSAIAVVAALRSGCCAWPPPAPARFALVRCWLGAY